MSIVTGLTLICSLSDGEVYGDAPTPTPNILALNRWLTERNFAALKDVSEHSGGSKHPQCCTFHCGYNYFPSEEFAAVVLALDWNEPENLVLIMQPEEGASVVVRLVGYWSD
jgi:hypothetical protein